MDGTVDNALALYSTGPGLNPAPPLVLFFFFFVKVFPTHYVIDMDHGEHSQSPVRFQRAS